MRNFKIGKKVIGANKVFIIAEIGINHNGDLSTCKKLVYEAKKSGADAVKLQIINPEESYSKSTKSYRIFKKNYLNFNEIKKIKIYAKKSNILLFATPMVSAKPVPIEEIADEHILRSLSFKTEL